MAISAKDVMALRQRTGMGMMECKEALQETGGDADAAVELLREKAGGKMDERTDREAGEGVIAVAKGDGAIAIVELRSETDFVARNETFVAGGSEIAKLMLDAAEGEITEPTDAMKKIIDDLRISTRENVSLSKAVKLTGAKVGSYVHHNGVIGAVVAGEGDLSDELLTGICQHIVAASPQPIAVDEAGIPAEQLEAAKQEAVDEAKASGKPQEIAEKIATGKLRKWVDDNTLMGQVYLREMEAKKPIRDYVPKGAKITGYAQMQVGS